MFLPTETSSVGIFAAGGLLDTVLFGGGDGDIIIFLEVKREEESRK